MPIKDQSSKETKTKAKINKGENMPYELRKFKGGYKVCKKDSDKCFSNDPMSKEKAEDQMAALYANESFKARIDNILSDE